MLIALIGISMAVYLLEDERMRLISTNEELANFLYRTSHDLCSPVTTLLLIIMMARKQPTAISPAQTLNMIENRVKKLDTVINDISEMTMKMAAEIHHHKIEFDQLIETLVAQVQQTEGGHKIAFEYLPSPENTFFSDYSYLCYILCALIDNCIQYRNTNKDRSRVILSISKNSVAVTLEIWDNGKGNHQEACRMYSTCFIGEIQIRTEWVEVILLENFLTC